MLSVLWTPWNVDSNSSLTCLGSNDDGCGLGFSSSYTVPSAEPGQIWIALTRYSESSVLTGVRLVVELADALPPAPAPEPAPSPAPSPWAAPAPSPWAAPSPWEMSAAAAATVLYAQPSSPLTGECAGLAGLVDCLAALSVETVNGGWFDASGYYRYSTNHTLTPLGAGGVDAGCPAGNATMPQMPGCE